jgi:ethanolamine phosphate phosphodiesterase
VTVKSFSLANQIRRPGFQLLSLVSPPFTASHSVHTFADRPCFLPDQYSIYGSVYGPFLLLTILLLFFSNLYRARQQRTSLPSPISLSPSTGRQDGADTPVLHPESAVWSPYTPFSPQAIPRSPSPRAIPPSARTTNGLAAPTLRAFSRPSSPHNSPLLSPMFPHDEDEDDSMYPAQYAIRREGLVQPISMTRSPVQASSNPHHAKHTRSSSQFLPAPGVRTADRHRWTWSRSFIIRGRRLRLTLNPSSFSLAWLKMLLSPGADPGDVFDETRRSVVVGTIIDALAIAWPAVVVWIVIAQWIF